MNKQFYKDAFGWGIILWLLGYALSLVLFAVVPTLMIGWIIMPVGVAVTLWVLFKKIKVFTFNYYILIGVVWVLIAVVLDYLFIVKAFNPVDGYYKLDVYLYYALTFLLPVVVGWRNTDQKHEK